MGRRMLWALSLGLLVGFAPGAAHAGDLFDMLIANFRSAPKKTEKTNTKVVTNNSLAMRTTGLLGTKKVAPPPATTKPRPHNVFGPNRTPSNKPKYPAFKRSRPTIVLPPRK